MSSQSYTPAVLACRKILMNVAVSLGAKAGDPFVSYVQFLADRALFPQMENTGWITSGRNRTRQTTKLL